MMREAEVPVTFQPLGKTVHVLRGTKLLEAAAVAGIVVDVPCGGEGICGKCRVIVRHGAAPPTDVEAGLFGADELRGGWRLACQCSVSGSMVVEVPDTSQLATYHKILAHAEHVALESLDPAVRKQYLEVPAPRREDDCSDLARLERVLGPLVCGLDLLRELPGRLRQSGFRGTATLANGRLIEFEAQDTTAHAYAAAVDVGTTTLAATLLDLVSGRPVEVVSRLNPQTSFGDDVLSRILYARERADGPEQLRLAIVEAIDAMIGQLAEQAAVDRRQIYELSFAGNTTMQQLLCGIDCRALGEVPFVPALGRSQQLPAAELGLHVHPRAQAVVLPVIGGFVGGDTVAGILATGLAEATEPALLVDIGTNGEIVLCADGKLSAASTAAGPAFEGARISHGMRGSTGAIEKVVVDGRLRINVIDDVPPIGLCGSALIDVAAELLRHGVVTPEGRLQPQERLPVGTPEDLVQRVALHDGKLAFVLASADESGTGRPIVLTQRDLRELQLATGAIRAGIQILLARAGLQPIDLKSVLVAGGFGNFIRRNNAQRIGLLPHGIPHHAIRYQGNTSLAGAQLVALSRQARCLADELARRTEHVDLGFNPAFQAAFAEAMIFPQ